MIFITNVEQLQDGYTRSWIVPAGTPPTSDLELEAVRV